MAFCCCIESENGDTLFLLEHRGRILEEVPSILEKLLPILEQSTLILEQIEDILEYLHFIRTNKNILEDFRIY